MAKRLTLLPALGLALACVPALRADPMLVYIGTYTQTTAPTGSRGIYALRFDPETGAFSEPAFAGEARNPTFLAFGPGERALYATGEAQESPMPSPANGCLSAFAVEPGSGALTLLNRVTTGPGGTTHVAADATGRMALAVSYPGNYLCAYALGSDGRFGARVALIRDEGPLGPNKQRQNQPHPHSVTLSPDNRSAYVCDLGLDRVYAYRIDPAKPSIEPAAAPFVAAPPGAGPRHSKMTPDGRFLYVVDEMGGTVCVYRHEGGALSLQQTIPTLPPDFSGLDNSAEVRIHPSGRFVYASNRDISGKKQDSLAVFARDPETGRLSSVEIVPSGGVHPRNFALTPDGRWLLCANRDTNNVVAFRVDPASGRLTLAPYSASLPMPVCVLIRD